VKKKLNTVTFINLLFDVPLSTKLWVEDDSDVDDDDNDDGVISPNDRSMSA
jgi:hypothetical protein